MRIISFSNFPDLTQLDQNSILWKLFIIFKSFLNFLYLKLCSETLNSPSINSFCLNFEENLSCQKNFFPEEKNLKKKLYLQKNVFLKNIH